MNRLSSHLETIRDHYEVVVVGSGYGGAVAAFRLASAGREVALLERGREILPGEYPATARAALRDMQAKGPTVSLGSPTSLFDFHLSAELSVLCGCGLGGTSLINAGVSLRADPRVFQDARWPAVFRESLSGPLDAYYPRAESMLQPATYPENLPVLAKLQALESVNAKLGGSFFRAPINVAFHGGPSAAGLEQAACTLCGNCVTGCNVGAKGTLLMNYLPAARSCGAKIFTQAQVRWIEHAGGRWKVYYEWLESGRERFGAPPLVVTADLVILAAGTMGSTELLLRSKARGLLLSNQVGRHFSSNGDILSFAYNTPRPVNGVGAGGHCLDKTSPVGPTITGVVDLRSTERVRDGFVVEEGVIPGALATVVSVVLARDAAGARGYRDARAETLRSRVRMAKGLARGARRGAIRHTLTYLVMAHDEGNGQLFLENDRLRIAWPSLSRQPIYGDIHRRLECASRILGGQYIRKSIAESLLRSRLISVHPLGGCVMADDATQGVTDHRGQVFSASEGTSTYDNLYVMDGSIIPSSLGVNPLLTIAALAERATGLLLEAKDWRTNGAVPSAHVRHQQPSGLGLQFTEVMRGYFSRGSHAPLVSNHTGHRSLRHFQRSAEQGRREKSVFELTLTIGTDSLPATLADAAHSFHMTGSAHAPALSPKPLAVTEGEFELLAPDPERATGREMCYRAKMIAENGKVYYLAGFKRIRGGALTKLWPETTTLYIIVYEGENTSAPIAGRGILRMSPENFLRQLTTIEVRGVRDPGERMNALARFGRTFFGTLWDTYGGIASRPGYFNPDAPPREKRPLRAPAPEIHSFTTEDGVELRLLRYCGGSKGPVILVHGVGVSSLIFRIDTIQTNLVEYLVARGFEVWALDYRASIELPASSLAATLDDVAAYDYPAAVAKVRELTGAPSVQVVAHCYGSIGFFMAMLKGLKGIRSAVCSQVAAHLVAPPMTRIKCGLYVPEFLDALGVKSLTAYVDGHADWQARLYETAMKLYPISSSQRCTSPVCHRITFMYSQAFEHRGLNAATHDALGELFGITHVRAFEHLARLVRKGHIVTARGEDAYLPHLDRLALPIAFIHGARNRCFLPESTRRTYNLLRASNGRRFYRRYVIPGYGHSDSILGKKAARDVYPYIARHLEATNGL